MTVGYGVNLNMIYPYSERDQESWCADDVPMCQMPNAKCQKPKDNTSRVAYRSYIINYMSTGMITYNCNIFSSTPILFTHNTSLSFSPHFFFNPHTIYRHKYFFLQNLYYYLSSTSASFLICNCFYCFIKWKYFINHRF